MIAYKAFEFNLSDRQGNIYEMNKWYKEKNDIDYIPPHGKRGFHACSNPWDTLPYFKHIRVMKVEIDEFEISALKNDRIGDVYIAQRFRIIEDVNMNICNITKEEINWLYVSSHVKLTDEEYEHCRGYLDMRRYRESRTNKRYIYTNN